MRVARACPRWLKERCCKRGQHASIGALRFAAPMIGSEHDSLACVLYSDTSHLPLSHTFFSSRLAFKSPVVRVRHQHRSRMKMQRPVRSLGLLLPLLLLLALAAVTTAVDASPSKEHAALARQAILRAQMSPRVHALLARESTYAYLDHPNELIRERAASTLNCSICEGFISLVTPLLESPGAEALIEALATDYCESIHPMCGNPTACAQVCTGLVSEYTAEVLSLLFSWALVPENFCAAIGECPMPPPPAPDGRIPVRSDLRNRAGEISWPSWGKEEGMGTFVHLSDVHLDLDYAPGMSTACGLPVCCHVTDGPGTASNDTAGYWGDYVCDTPMWLAEDLMSHLTSLPAPPDFVIYTGDDPAHDVWKQSQAENLAAIRAFSTLINSTLGSDIPIFHTLGNHEAFPINQFGGPGVDSWLLDACVSAWAPFLPEDAQKTMAYGGYYQARARPGLRVISLNSNYLTNDNFYLLANQSDAWEQLNWLSDVLSQALELGEKAIIICHAPVDSWNDALASAFIAIAAEYETVIVNLFMGHTHQNEIHTLHRPTNATGTMGEAMHVAWVAGSVVPFGWVNPGYNLLHYNRSLVANPTQAGNNYTHLVQEVEAHWIDLDKVDSANSTSGQWEIIRWAARKDLGVSGLDAATLSNLAPAFISNVTLYQSYINAMFKGVLQSNALTGSDPPSAAEVACDISFDTDAQQHACMHSLAGRNEDQIREREKTALGVC